MDNTRMKIANRFCGKCGARFFADAPQEFCSACLLESGLFSGDDEEAGSSESGGNGPRRAGDRISRATEESEPHGRVENRRPWSVGDQETPETFPSGSRSGS